MALALFKKGETEGTKYRDGRRKLTEKEINALKKVQEMFTEAFDCRDSRKERMIKNENLYNNQPPKNTKTEADIKHALVLSTIETMLPVYGDYYPEISYHGENFNDYAFEDFMNQRSRMLLEACDFKSHGLLQAKNALIYSNGYMRIVPILNEIEDLPKNYDELSEEDKKSYQTLGGLDIEVLDPFCVFPDPVGKGVEPGKDCRYFIVAEPLPRAQVAGMYGMSEEDVTTTAFDWRDYKANTEDAHQNIEDVSQSDFTLLIKCYWMPEGEEYENGRLTVITGNQLLEDTPLGMPFIPYFNLANYRSSERFWGIGEPEIVASVAFAMNSFTSYITDNLSSYGKPKEIVSKELYQKLQSGLYDKTTIPVDDPSEYMLRSTDPVPPSIFSFLSVLMELFVKTSGVQESLEGKRPAGITSAEGIEALREASQVRVRHKITNDLKPMMKKIGIYVEYLIKTYDVQPVETKRENDIGVSEYQKLDPTRVLDKRNGKLVEKDKAEGIKERDRLVLSDTTMDVSVELGRGSMKGSVARELRASEMFDRGVIPYRMYVKDMRINPEKKQMLVEWYEQKNQAVQMISRMKKIADGMGQIKNAEDWVNSPEMKELEALVKQLQEAKLNHIIQTRM